MYIVRFSCSSQNICMFNYCDWGVLLIFRHTDVMYCIYTSLIKAIVLYMMSHWPRSFDWNPSFYELIQAWFICIYVCNIYLVMQKYVQVTIFILLTLFEKGVILFFPYSLVRTTYEINKITNIAYNLMVSY